MRNSTIASALASLLAAATPLHEAAAQTYSFTTIGSPGAGLSDATSISNSGLIAGYDADTAGTHGFLYAGGTYTSIDGPIAGSQTTAWDINDAGQVTGIYRPTDTTYQGFIYAAATGFTAFSVPGSSLTQALRINASGQIAGNWSNARTADGFIRDPATGAITNISVPGAPGLQVSTDVRGLNDAGAVTGLYTIEDAPGHAIGFIESGGAYSSFEVPGARLTYGNAINGFNQVAGTSVDTNGLAHGFIYDNGALTMLDAPSAAFGTFALDINQAGMVDGYLVDATNHAHGFVYNHGTWVVLDVPGANYGTWVDDLGDSLNDAGSVVGFYNVGGLVHGFTATLVPEPATLAILASTLPLLAAARRRTRRHTG